MSGKRRHYPQAQYQVQQAAIPQPIPGQGAVPGAPFGGAYPPQPQQPGVYGQQPGANDPYFINPAAGIPQLQYGGAPVAGYPQQQPINDITQGLGGMSLTGAPQQPHQPAYGQPQQQQQQPAYGQPAVGYGQPQNGYGQQPQTQQQLPLNKIYQSDLLREIPPPISDLSLPPPPLILNPNLQTVPSSTTANASADYFRSTLNAVPSSHSVLKKTKLPFALVIRPYTALKDEHEPVPLVTDTIVSRCRRCRTYINPFVEMVDGGMKWRCNMCSLKNDVPQGFDTDVLTNMRADRFERNELNHGIVEFIAPTNYSVRPPQPLVYVFVIDVTVNAVKTGLLATVAASIAETLDAIPNKDERTRVAFLGVDKALHYFSVPEDSEQDGNNNGNGSSEFQCMVVPDLDEPFAPIADGLLINLQNSRESIGRFLQQLPSLYENNITPEFALGPALKAAHNLIHSVGGKVIAFASNLPSTGVGKLTVRDENSVADKAKEASALLGANDAFYKSFAVECNKSQVSIELFLTSSTYQDVASLANLPRYTAGQTHYYPGWTASNLEDITKLSKEITKTLTSDIALEAVLRTRASSGLRMNAFYGSFFNRSSDLCSFPTFPRDQSYVVEVAIDETISKPVVYFQTAVLHSTSFGERRIRVITAAIPVTSNPVDVFASADQLAITNYLTHKAIEKVYSSSLNDARDFINKQAIEILQAYNKEAVNSNAGGAAPLNFCANLRMLPLLLHALTKHIGLRSGIVASDHRANALNLLGTLPLPHLIRYIYPTVYSLHDIADEVGFPSESVDGNGGGDIVLPTPINATGDLFQKYGLYLINTTTELFLWIGGEAVPELVNDVFGIPDIFQVRLGKVDLPELDNPFNERVRNIINKVRESNDSVVYQTLFIVRGGSANEPLNDPSMREVSSLRSWANSYLVEDRVNRSSSYKESLLALKDKIGN